jgi:formate dehydrogenase subunit gamma
MALQLAAQEISDRVGAIVDRNIALEGPLLPILHDVQGEFGFVPHAALTLIANRLNLSRAEVHGVMSFYHDFREERTGRHVLKLCRAEACQSMGGDRVAEHAQTVLGIEWHGTTPDGSVTLEPVYCLGLCACGPAAMLDGRVIGRLDEERIDRIAKEVRA